MTDSLTIEDSALPSIQTGMQSSLGDWKWTFVLLGVSLLSLAIYKLGITQTVANNGRVTTQFHLPIKPAADFFRYILHRIKPRSLGKIRVITPAQQQFYARVYSAQEIIFGTLLYVFGLLILVISLSSVVNFFNYTGQPIPIPLSGFGLMIMYWGYRTVTRRQQYNPFLCRNPPK